MPYKSQAQQGKAKVGSAVVKEFDAASKGRAYRKLPKHVNKRKLKQYGGDRA